MLQCVFFLSPLSSQTPSFRSVSPRLFLLWAHMPKWGPKKPKSSPGLCIRIWFPFTSTKCNIYKEMEMLLLCFQSRMMLSLRLIFLAPGTQGTWVNSWRNGRCLPLKHSVSTYLSWLPRDTWPSLLWPFFHDTPRFPSYLLSLVLSYCFFSPPP